MYPIHSAIVVALLLVVKLVGLKRVVFALALLLACILPIVDLDCYSDVFIE